jgi:type IV secretory pathway ATPase VirB11/archaellum biosynthesis ATPase
MHKLAKLPSVMRAFKIYDTVLYALLTVHEDEMVVDALAENALNAPPISIDVLEVIVSLVLCVCETPIFVEYFTS